MTLVGIALNLKKKKKKRVENAHICGFKRIERNHVKVSFVNT